MHEHRPTTKDDGERISRLIGEWIANILMGSLIGTAIVCIILSLMSKK